MRFKMMGCALITVLTMSAIAASAASATAKLLTLTEVSLTEGTRLLMPGDLFATFGHELKFETPAGLVDCSENTDGLIGKVVTNEAKKDQISIEEVEINEHEPSCLSTIVGLGSPHVTASALPWTLALGATGKTELKSATKVTFSMAFSGGALCVYESAKLKGSEPVGTTPKPFEAAFLSQKLKLNKTLSSKVCPKSALLGAGFLQSESFNGSSFNSIYAHN